jgi:hypothetical protein
LPSVVGDSSDSELSDRILFCSARDNWTIT